MGAWEELWKAYPEVYNKHDGPAITHIDGTKEWWENGKYYHEQPSPKQTQTVKIITRRKEN